MFHFNKNRLDIEVDTRTGYMDRRATIWRYCIFCFIIYHFAFFYNQKLIESLLCTTVAFSVRL